MSDKPETRLEATEPEAAKNLDPAEQRAVEAEGDAQHSEGAHREELIREAKKNVDAPASSEELASDS